MTTTSLLSLGTSALYAANAQLLTTSNNIANANTEGYSRQSARLETSGSQQSRLPEPLGPSRVCRGKAWLRSQPGPCPCSPGSSR